MKNMKGMKSLTVHIPTKDFDRIANAIRLEHDINNPEEIIARFMGMALMMGWRDDPSIWAELADYRNREHALNSAKVFFEDHPRDERPLELTYRWAGDAWKTERFPNPLLGTIQRRKEVAA